MYRSVLLFVLVLSFVASFKAQDPGALVHIYFESTVGVNLDDAAYVGPAFYQKTVNHLLTLNQTFWIELANLQTDMMEYRAIFRSLFYNESEAKGSLPFTPRSLWTFTFDPSGPSEIQIDGHPYLAINYTYEQYLLSDLDSPVCSDTNLALNSTQPAVESWFLPVDPEFLLARTGYACIDEEDFPVNSVTSENAWAFYDDTCTIETPPDIVCHITSLPDEDCVDSLSLHVGRIEISVSWTRVPWNQTIADLWRFGSNPFPGAEKATAHHPDTDLRLQWRYFDASACELDSTEGGCILDSGWRRVLMFSTSSTNVGKSPLVLGDVLEPQWLQYPVFDYSPCHEHYHFRGFSDYNFGNLPASFKMGFCLQDTIRSHNNEFTPICSDFPTCAIQGASPGWTDDYFQGIPCNWVDVTGLNPGTYNLTQIINPFGLVCEGTPILNNSTGAYDFVITNYTDYEGDPYWKVVCDLHPNYLDNNVDVKTFSLAGPGSAVTLPCFRHLSGPLRDCGFSILADNLACTAGQSQELTINLPAGADPQVIRICESSVEHLQTTACEYMDALWNSVVITNSTSSTIIFACPASRSTREPGGKFSILYAPVLESDAFATGMTYQIVPNSSGSSSVAGVSSSASTLKPLLWF